MNDLLIVSEVSHRFGAGKLALDGVNLRLVAGETMCLVGPSGCGKTTLLRVIAGLEPLQCGTIKLAGQQLSRENSPPPELRNIGMVFQDYALFPHLSVFDNVCFGLRGLDRRVRRERAVEVLVQLGLADQIKRFPHTLSAGQQQRVALARSLAPRPSVLLLDEPFSGLDPALRHQVREQILAVLKQYALTSVIVTHDPQEAVCLGDRIALMRQGSIVQVADPMEIYTSPVDPFTAAFFGQTNHLTGVVRGRCVDTPAGRVSLEACSCSCEHHDGELVTVVVRPEGIQLGGSHSKETVAQVESARWLGRNGWVGLQTVGKSAVKIWASVPWGSVPEIGSLVTLSLDHRQTFIFPSHPEDAGPGVEPT